MNNFAEMQEVPLVAIKCLVYNHEPYLRDCFEGFVMQKTNFRFVAIVHEDCSTDKSADIIREYEAKYPDIIKPIYETENQYSKPDGSLTRIMAEAIKATGAKYIAICEGDDYWTDPYKLQKQVDILEANPNIVGVFTDTTLVDKNSNILQSSRMPYHKSFAFDMDKFCEGGYDNMPTLTAVYRSKDDGKRAWRTSTMRNAFLGDWTLWIALLQEGSLYYLDEVTGAYRVNPTSVTHTVNLVARHKATFDILKNVRKVVPKKYWKHFSTRGWAWWNVANAYRKYHRYLPMIFYLFMSFVTSPSWFVKNIKELRKKKQNT